MKRITLFTLLTSVSMVMFAQATDLVVDNQNPGWLSNVISFDDQKTVKNLKVTGYINDTDLKFIGTLMTNRSLDRRLDLSDANVVDIEGKDNYLGKNMFGLDSNKEIQYLSLPKTCTDFYNCLDIYVDTLMFDCNTHIVTQEFLGTMPYHMIVGNNIDTIPNAAFFGKSPISIKLSVSTKYIGDRAFANSKLECLNFCELESLEYLGDFAFVEFNTKQQPYSLYSPDTIIVPDALKSFNSGAFMFKKGQHFFFGESIESITASEGQPTSISKYGLCSTYAADKGIILHMKTNTPPSLYATLSNKHTVYVPKGTKQNYLNSNFGSANIIEENPLVKILLDKHTTSLEVGETQLLTPTFFPSDADDMELTWRVKDESIAKVENGVVTALAPGKTWVYAKSVVEDVKDSCEVTVIQQVTDIAFDTPAVTLEGIGATVQLNVIVTPEDATDKSVTWSSSNPSVCVVSNGKIVAVGYGTSVVIATSVDGGHMAVATVKVNEAGFVTLTIQQSANGAVSTQVEKGIVQTFAIQAESGWKIHSVTFNDADVTSELDATNHYTTPTITENSTLFVTFEEDTATDVKATDASVIRVQGMSFGVRILNAANETANIYTPDGVLVKTVKVAGAQMDIELPEGSIYLVKIADKTVKVSR
jgi:uncharacterized protein YjdB